MELIQGGKSSGTTYDPPLTPEQVDRRLNASPDWQMTKHQARDELAKIIAQKTTQPRADERIVTSAWFTHNRFLPLREGRTWKVATAETHKSAIEKDILAPLGDLPLAQVNKVRLQTHLSDLAKKLSGARVQHARFYLKAIFEEAIEQDFGANNPARKLILPNQLRVADRTTLSGEQLRLVLASVPLRDRIRLTLDMPETFRPSELFARGGAASTWTRARLWSARPPTGASCATSAKTKKSLRTVHLPAGRANELWLWKQPCPDRSPEAFIVPNARKRDGVEQNGFICTDNIGRGC